ncbi:MAG: type IV toxin-antitoxin system AbiEi family antitoxin domain-containing protein [Victivallaceae bacterium]|nr:type IV toxin-antitoxin system AbiEi family antitoxin domain-containing protein [Victivallaceae bacterium]
MGKYKKQLTTWLDANKPFSAAEIRAAGIPSQILVELCGKGEIERLCRGVYISSKAQSTSELSLQIAMLKMPKSIVCLLSALRFHNFTTQLPHDVWLAVKPHSWIPQNDELPLKIVAFSEESYSYGVEEHEIDGMKIKVYSAAKTVADCFKFRNKIGLDVAMEALREGYHLKLFTVSELMKAAKVCRVTNIITPYIESLLE